MLVSVALITAVKEKLIWTSPFQQLNPALLFSPNSIFAQLVSTQRIMTDRLNDKLDSL